MADTAEINSGAERQTSVDLGATTFMVGSVVRPIPERMATWSTPYRMDGYITDPSNVLYWGDAGANDTSNRVFIAEWTDNPPADGFLWSDGYVDGIPVVTPAAGEFDLNTVGSAYQNPALGGSGGGGGGSVRPASGLVYPRRI